MMPLTAFFLLYSYKAKRSCRLARDIQTQCIFARFLQFMQNIGGKGRSLLIHEDKEFNSKM